MSNPVTTIPLPRAASADSQEFRRLLGRLLQPVHPRVAEAVRRQPATATTEVLTAFVRGRVGLREASVEDVGELGNHVGRLLCLANSGRPMLLEALADGGWLIQLDSALPPRPLRSAVLKPLFPCTIYYL